MKTIVFIVGAGHSGSTLLAKALNAHSKIFAVSEIANFGEDIKSDIALCGCSTKLKECPFWEDLNRSLKQKLGYGIKDDAPAFTLFPKIYNKNKINNYFYRLKRFLAVNCNIKNSRLKKHLRNIKLLFNIILEKTNTEIVVDSSKSAKRAYVLKKYLKKFYNIKIIHLVRDGRAVLYSYSKGYYQVKMKNPETGKQELKTFYAERIRPQEEILKIWKKYNKTAFSYHKTFFGSKDYFFLRYEDFASQPEYYLKKMLEHIGYEYEPEMLNLNRFENHMVCGNASRINAVKIQKPFETWRKKLSRKQLEYFNKYGQKFNQKLGYQS